MIFNTPIFLLFFVAFLALYGLVFLRQRPRIFLIVLASLVFYGAWNYRFIPLLVGSGLADFLIAKAIHRSNVDSSRKRWLALSVAINLGVLGLFKYADFALQSVTEFLGLFGVDPNLPALSWVLPVGISFYTFQSLSYTIDVYRREMEPTDSFPNFLAALSFFPQLVAGPILRAKQILPQMESLPTPNWSDAKHGLLLITAGVLKKTLADLLAISAGRAFDSAEPVSLLETWTGTLAFAGQIYGDFSGYTDMAIGIALLLGFKIPRNFRVPYLAISPVDFWRRWHISLSTWLRDYLYISLGGNRNGRRWLNVMITMLLGGLWHGAAWTFVIWGFFHGILIALSHFLGSLKIFAPFNDGKTRWVKPIKWALTLYLVLMGWVLFRATTLGGAKEMLLNLHGLGGALPAPAAAAGTLFLFVAGSMLLVHAIDYFILTRAEKLESRPWIFWILLVIAQALCLFIGEPSNEFIYFQF